MTDKSLKKIISNLLGSTYKIKGAMYSSNCTGTRTDARTWRSANDFTGLSNSFKTSDSNYFEADVNGIKVLKAGYYAFFAYAHFNCSISAAEVAIRIYNTTQDMSISMDAFGRTGTSWQPASVGTLQYCNAGDVIITKFQKNYNDTSTTWRPSTTRLIALKVD